MNMKKYMFAGALALAFAGCTDSFLEEEMVATITQDYLATEEGVDQRVVG